MRNILVYLGCGFLVLIMISSMACQRTNKTYEDKAKQDFSLIKCIESAPNKTEDSSSCSGLIVSGEKTSEIFMRPLRSSTRKALA